MSHTNRRQFLSTLGAGLGARLAPAAPGGKSIRGVFPIMATPFNEAKEVDFDDLVKEAGFLDRCGVHGMVWPQLASEYWLLKKEERMRGMELLARAMKGRRPALILGVQGPNTEAMLEYARRAEELEPDGMIAIPPTEAKTLDDFLNYYRALAGVTKRPIFVQTSGGARSINPTIEALVSLAREFPNCAYVKEEYAPIIERMKQLTQHRPPIRGIFSGAHGKGWTYEMRLGCDGTCPGSALSDVYVRIWDLYQGGKKAAALEAFAKLMLLVNLDSQIPGTFQYLMKLRGVFKTTVSRQREYKYTPEAAAEIEFNFAALKPLLKA
ncbi:MAG: dihydrodipicolinate synthase family protein [Acidobacteria bacterium]|nr:dihydrodipicolinate synthase family protein [Acidobacteriota bacterium]